MPHWSKPLARQLTLTGAPRRTITNLKNAAELLTEHFAGTKSIVLHAAIERLRRAAATGKKADIEVATKQVERFLRLHKWM